jgi:hypothetical protein
MSIDHEQQPNVDEQHTSGDPVPQILRDQAEEMRVAFAQQHYPLLFGAFSEEVLKQLPITLLPEKSTYSVRELEDMWPDTDILVCDFCVENIQNGEAVGGDMNGEDVISGYAQGRVTNIDHHAPVDVMAVQISSAPLAIAYVKKNGVVPPTTKVVVHHTDCDSVLSSGIMRGILPPDLRFHDAAIAADHTGAVNEIADLLQAIESKRDLAFSLDNLQRLLKGQPLDDVAAKMLAERLEDRVRVAASVAGGDFGRKGDVFFTAVDKRVDAGFLPALLPDAVAIIMGTLMKEPADMWAIKVRLGQKAPKGLALNQLGLEKFGGRWNAGNTKRDGGTAKNPEEYAQMLDVKIQEWMGAHL